jgi:hypothetical protein
MRTRDGWGLLLLLAAATASGAVGLGRALFAPPDPEVAAELDYYDRQRFEGVRPLLPRPGVIGYREDSPPRSGRVAVVFRFTQYALTPVVLREDAGGPLVLVNGRAEAAPHPKAGGRPLPLLRDAGDGVRLYGARGP